MNQNRNSPPATQDDNHAIPVDEPRLEQDACYRFKYVADVIGLGPEDQVVLRKHRAMVEPHLNAIVTRVYDRMFQFNAMKRHFLYRHAGFEGGLPVTLAEMTLEHKQTEFRKMRLQEYFVKLCTADWDDTFAILLDLVGHIHTPNQGNRTLNVPLVQVAALLGLINDLFLETISELELSGKTQLALQRAFTKLFWVQNNLFLRHWVKEPI